MKLRIVARIFFVWLGIVAMLVGMFLLYRADADRCRSRGGVPTYQTPSSVRCFAPDVLR